MKLKSKVFINLSTVINHLSLQTYIPIISSLFKSLFLNQNQPDNSLRFLSCPVPSLTLVSIFSAWSNVRQCISNMAPMDQSQVPVWSNVTIVPWTNKHGSHVQQTWLQRTTNMAADITICIQVIQFSYSYIIQDLNIILKFGSLFFISMLCDK